jgi:hypothetical protein
VIAEKLIIDRLKAALGIPVYFGMQPQGDDEAPSKMPVVIVNRSDSGWSTGFSGTDPDLSITRMQIDYYAEQAAEARGWADTGRLTMIGMVHDDGAALAPSLSDEQSFYDQVSRGWRVMQTWVVTDYAPAIPIPNP